MSEVTPTLEQQQRAKWDRLLDDIEARHEQLRQMRFRPWRAAVAGMILGALLFAAGLVLGGALVHLR